MGARKLRETPVQLMSLDAIKVDRSLQSRVATSIEYQREFSEAMLRGDEFPPVVVFFDGKNNWLADGFHRVGAAKKAGKREIRAEVREGARRDALIFSAGANQKFSIPRTREDIRKAVEMVLSDAEGFNWAVERIAGHVGCAHATARRHRADYLSERNLVAPEQVVNKNGTLINKKASSTTWEILHRINRGNQTTPYYAARRKGHREIYLSTDREVADAKLRELNRGETERPLPRGKTRKVSCGTGLIFWLSQAGFWFQGHKEQDYPGISGHHGRGRVFVHFEEIAGIDFLAAVGRVLLLRQRVDVSSKPVIVCHHDTFHEGPIELARQIGIEVLTPEEFLEALRAEKTS